MGGLRALREGNRLRNLDKMTITPAAIAAAAAAELPLFFNDTFDQFVQGEGEYIRAGEPKSVTSQIGQAVARAACRRYGSGAATPTAAQAERYERACRPYLDDIGLGKATRLVVPVRGGQCPSTLYSFTLRRFFPDGTDIGNQTISCGGGWYGPIGVFREFSGGSHRVGITGFNSAGLPRRSDTIVGGGPGARVEPFGFVKCLGGADNCGNAPVVVDPIPPGTDPTPPPFRFNPSPTVDVDIDVDVNVDGSITFNIGTGDITVDPFTGADGTTGGGGAEVAPTTPGVSGSAEDTGLGGESDGEAPEGKELTGVLVAILASPVDANRFKNNSTQPFRGAGYISMGYPGLLGVDPSGGVFSSPQFFHAQQRGLTAWRTSANLGFNLRTTPYYRDIPE